MFHAKLRTCKVPSPRLGSNLSLFKKLRKFDHVFSIKIRSFVYLWLSWPKRKTIDCCPTESEIEPLEGSVDSTYLTIKIYERVLRDAIACVSHHCEAELSKCWIS